MSISFVSPNAAACIVVNSWQPIDVQFTPGNGGEKGNRLLSWSTDDYPGLALKYPTTWTGPDGRARNFLTVGRLPSQPLRISVWESEAEPNGERAAGHVSCLYDVVDAVISVNVDRVAAAPSSEADKPARSASNTIRATFRAMSVSSGAPGRNLPITLRGEPHSPSGVYTVDGERLRPDVDDQYTVWTDVEGVCAVDILDASEEELTLWGSTLGNERISKTLVFSRLMSDGDAQATLPPLSLETRAGEVDLNGPSEFVMAKLPVDLDLETYANCTVFSGRMALGPVPLTDLPKPGVIPIPKAMLVSTKENRITYCLSTNDGELRNSAAVNLKVKGVPPAQSPPDRTLPPPDVGAAVVDDALIDGGLQVVVKLNNAFLNNNLGGVAIYVNDEETRRSLKLVAYQVLFSEVAGGYVAIFDEFALAGFSGTLQAEYWLTKQPGGLSVAYSRLLTVGIKTRT